MEGFRRESHIRTTGANKPEKKDQCLKPMYTAWLSFL